ncbi:extracellular solute-binding protein [Breznakiella homolactica]|uniref:sn-glycerol-3-phosphate-binding periplasmic protein UgpB n=1 Tax=Breznakiella homolactica TaxID=2798577 RepID=A0A7T7XLE9_9SPIR|nr:extracellular solute-binding protein [Breznakiella homolactica]QQO08455.1 extracellular solute-binding protein [Breznakiella homolactica]
MKRLITAVLAICLLVPAAVFAGGSKEGTGAQDGMIQIEFWHTMSGVNGGAIDKLAENFNSTIGREKGIIVKSVFQGNDNSEKLKTLAQAGDFRNFPDIAQIAGAGIPSAITYEQLVPVQSMFEKGGSTLTRDEIEPNMLRAYTYRNQLVGMPVSCSAILLFYNQDMFRSVGLDPNRPPATIADMAQAISKLMIKKGSTVDRYGLNVAVRRYQLSNFIGGQGTGNYFGDNEGGRTAPMTRVTFGDDGTLMAFLNEWEKVINTGGYKPVEDNINEEFALELFGMAIMSTARIGIVTNLVQDNFKWAVAPLPKVKATDTGGISVGGSCVVMFDPAKDSSRVNAAWEFVQYLASPDAQFQFHKDTGYIPVNRKVYELPGVDQWFAANPSYKVAVDAIHASNPIVQEPFDIINWEIDSVIREHMLNFATGKETKQQCHDAIVRECNEKLAAYHRANS